MSRNFNSTNSTDAVPRGGVRIREFIYIFLLVFLTLPLGTASGKADEQLVAAYYSDRYHVASCKIAQKIHPDDRVYYKNPEEAAAAGLVPCKKCNPPVPAGTEKPKQNFKLKSKLDPDSDNGA